jgi:NitT/TauT family transport system substrate-binding protein
MYKSALNICLLAAALVTVFSTHGCEEMPDEALIEVTYRLKWLFNTSVVGDLYADAHGIFADHGLRVTIKEGGPERDAIKELELGHAQFGVASADQVIRALSKGAPIVVIGQLFQKNPLQWMYRPDKASVNQVQDLRGKTIGVTYGGNDEAIMKALLAKYRIREDEVNLFSVRYDYTPFYRGQVTFWPVYQNAEGVVINEKLRKSGEEVRFLDPDALGIRFVANSVITTKQLLKEHPETVKGFMEGLLEGWRQAIDPKNTEKAIETIQVFDRDTPVHIISKQLEATRNLVKPSQQKQIGWIDVAAWAETKRIMLEQGLIPGPVSLERVLIPFREIRSPFG